MNTIIFPRPGTSGARPLPALSYHRAPVKDLRAFPVRDNKRLHILDYRLTEAPGMPGRSPRTHGHGAARLAGGFVLSLCIVQSGGEWFLEVACFAYDEIRGRRDPVEITPRILADVYRGVQQKQINAQARAYGRTGGRN